MSESRILLVDDEEMVRDAIAASLRSKGYLVETAASAEEALALASHVPDLLVADVTLPGRSGAELADDLRHENPDLPVILLSGFPDAARVDRALFLQKPFLPSELLEAVSATLPRA